MPGVLLSLLSLGLITTSSLQLLPRAALHTYSVLHTLPLSQTLPQHAGPWTQQTLRASVPAPDTASRLKACCPAFSPQAPSPPELSPPSPHPLLWLQTLGFGPPFLSIMLRRRRASFVGSRMLHGDRRDGFGSGVLQGGGGGGAAVTDMFTSEWDSMSRGTPYSC